jgi:hypothetical protein
VVTAETVHPQVLPERQLLGLVVVVVALLRAQLELVVQVVAGQVQQVVPPEQMEQLILVAVVEALET